MFLNETIHFPVVGTLDRDYMRVQAVVDWAQLDLQINLVAESLAYF